ncbi:glycosyltransferase family 2 protein [Seonamhaeicola sp. ML3]|uniref:glycosyltransferase family 2 protein n=1 Tax=Seonamhaeicola sp. ML3 TaxID=2937786 RepID=UPI00200D0829|nr:glycosyltransferase family 2 protein [Seonamhaeicola sp. ML3]
MGNDRRNIKSIEILISTMNRTSLSFLDKMFSQTDYSNLDILIVNQTDKNRLLTSSFDNIRVINSYDKGLARSRNVALNNAEKDICLFADDDIVYKGDFIKTIQEAFAKYNSADIVTFKMEDNQGRPYDNYPNIVLHNRRTLRTANSVVIAVKREPVIGSGVYFNEHFGLGSIFETADEYVFLRSAIKSNLKLYFHPHVILSHPFYSSGKSVSEDKIIFARSAVFYKYNGILTYIKLIWHLFLLLKNRDLRASEIPRKYFVGLSGINKYRSLVKQGLEIRNS